jgi:hypothetical protein
VSIEDEKLWGRRRAWVDFTRSAMLRGCVAQPRLARILQGTASWNWRNFSMAAISDEVLGRLNWWDSPFCDIEQTVVSSGVGCVRKGTIL